MKQINTVLGPIAPADLGFTLMHEHVVVSASGLLDSYPGLLEPEFEAKAIASLQRAKAEGINSIVDATTFDLGRNAEFLVKVSEASGVNIINVTGWWLDVPRFLHGVSANQMAREFVKDIEVGFRGTAIKAGLLKCAADSDGVTESLETMNRAVARAHLETGVPIMVHSFPNGQVARRQIEIFKQEGVDLTRVKIDHANDSTDIEHLQWILDQGCYLGMDRYPGFLVSPHMRTVTLKSLIDAGYIHQLCPSQDCICQMPIKECANGTLPQDNEATLLNPDQLLYLKRKVIPELLEMGVSDSMINTLFVENPRRFFEG